MKNFTKYILFLSILSCSGIENNNSNAQFRFAQFITDSDKIEYSVSNEKGIVDKGTSAFENVTKYITAKPGIYDIKIKANNNIILNKRIGLGKGKYTLCLLGEILKGQKANKITTEQKMHNIVAGEEGTTSNGYLPQLIILNDYYSVKKGKSKIRFVHTITGLTDLEAKLIYDQDKTKKIKKIKYPHPSESHTLKEGKYKIKIYIKDSPHDVMDTSFQIDKNKLYTSLLYRDTENHIKMHIINSFKDK